MFVSFLAAATWTVGALAFVTLLLHVLPRAGGVGRSISAWLCRAPGLDLLVTIFTVLPLFVCPIRWHWMGLLGAIVGQLITLFGWTAVHELTHPQSRTGPRLYTVHHRLIGVFGNISSLIVMLMAAPTFWMIRMTQFAVYPWLVRFAKLPSYRQGEWVSVSRHRFDGLVGHDRIWCLYCDWMTGIWSLGSEMLRNLESFWCPIRFRDPSKCANCQLDFPDLSNGWVDAAANVREVVKTLEDQYEREPKPPSNAWFGHPVRLTVKGTDVGAPKA